MVRDTTSGARARRALSMLLAGAAIAAGLTGISSPVAVATPATTAVAWGDDSYSQGRVPAAAQPAVAVTASLQGHAAALRTDGTVVAWGANYAGQTDVPQGLSGVTAVAAGGDFTLALKSDGTVVGWGDSALGQTTVPQGLTGVTAISAGYDHSLALKSDHTVVAWGANDSGQATVPIGLSGVIAISASSSYSLALKSDGTVMAWGLDDYGQTDVPAGLTDVVGIAAAIGHALAVKNDGTVVAWGSNDNGESSVPAGLPGVHAVMGGLGYSMALKNDGSIVEWGADWEGLATVPAGLSAVAVAAGGYMALALKADGTIVPWGYDWAGEASVPTAVTNPSEVAAGCYSSLALLGNGTVVQWGGIGRTTNVQLPPDGLSGVVAVDAGGIDGQEPVPPSEHFLALKGDGTVIGWGDDAYQAVPMPTGLSGVVAISAGGEHSLALKGDGTVVAWGDDTYGQVTVPAGLTGVTAISAGGYFSLALKSDGTVVAWGSNDDGALNIPAGLSGVTAISAGGGHALALKSDGTVVAWGNNIDGEAVVPAGLTGVTKVVGGMWDSFAVKGDGTVVGWGWNGESEATAPAGLSGVTSLAAGCRHTLAIGTLTPPKPGAYVSLSPYRLLDTRSAGGTLKAGESRALQVTGRGGVPSTGVSAVVLNVTVTDTTSGGYLTASPTGAARPTASNLNWGRGGTTIPNAVTVKVGDGGSVDLYQSGPGTAQVIVDVAGYYMDGAVADAGAFTSLSPARILDTRTLGGTLAAGESRDLQITGAGGVPASNVSAVALNVTVTETTSGGYLTVYPSGTTQPLASNLNWAGGATIPNLVTVKVGSNGKVSLYQSGPGTAQVIVDVAGYYVGGTATMPGMFVALPPSRVLDTRSGSAVAANSDVTLPILGKGGIPASGVSAVVVNTTVTETSAPGYLTVYPGTDSLPTASNLNWDPGTTIPNLVTVKLGSDGSVSFHNGSGGATQVIADTAGYYLS